jgi:membrane protease YdiL (CAAX protease family)
MKIPDRIPLPEFRGPRACAALLLAGMCLTAGAPVARAAITAPAPDPASSQLAGSSEKSGSSLEAAAAKASSTGRAVAMSLIGLAFAVAAIVLAFKRDFKEAAGVFMVGIVCVLLATPTGVSVLQDTVNSLFGSH